MASPTPLTWPTRSPTTCRRSIGPCGLVSAGSSGRSRHGMPSAWRPRSNVYRRRIVPYLPSPRRRPQAPDGSLPPSRRRRPPPRAHPARYPGMPRRRSTSWAVDPRPGAARQAQHHRRGHAGHGPPGDRAGRDAVRRPGRRHGSRRLLGRGQPGPDARRGGGGRLGRARARHPGLPGRHPGHPLRVRAGRARSARPDPWRRCRDGARRGATPAASRDVHRPGRDGRRPDPRRRREHGDGAPHRRARRGHERRPLRILPGGGGDDRVRPGLHLGGGGPRPGLPRRGRSDQRQPRAAVGGRDARGGDARRGRLTGCRPHRPSRSSAGVAWPRRRP